MSTIDRSEEFAHLQDVLGQVLMVRTYTQICLCFAVPTQDSIPSILEDVRVGLSRLRAGFPWLAGQVVISGKGDGNTGLARMEPCEPNISYVIKDLTGNADVATFAALQQSKFPMNLLDRQHIAPLPAIPETFDDSKQAPLRVLEVQANIVQGGILLNFAGNHHICDMNGLGQIIHLFAKACRNEAFTTTELELGNCARQGLIPPYGTTYQPGPEMDYVVVQAKPAAATQSSLAGEADMPAAPAGPAAVWVYFAFSSQSLAELKLLASAQTQTDYITTNDALSAFVWQAITRARAKRIPDLDATTAMRAVDVRRYFKLPKEYVGHAVVVTLHTQSMVHDSSFADVAGQLRQELEKTDLAHQARALVTMLDRTKDKSSISYAAKMTPDRDLMFSSWSKTPPCTSNFGPLLGHPLCARRPCFAPIEGLIYFMPKDQDGSIAAAMCLQPEDIESLQEDQVFMNIAEYVG